MNHARKTALAFALMLLGILTLIYGHRIVTNTPDASTISNYPEVTIANLFRLSWAAEYFFTSRFSVNSVC